MKHLFLLSLLAIVTYSNHTNAQTKFISYKSHSGNKRHLNTALSSNLFSMGESNFGMAPQRMVRNSKLDTVILVSEKKAIMITSEYCHYEDYGGGDRSTASLWNAGKDTVYDHPIFNSGKSVSEIKRTLKQEYFFANPIDSVIFLGFDGEYYKETPKKIKQKAAPIELKKEISFEDENPQKEEPRKPKSLFMIFVLSVFSVICNCHF
jgi:hypothetical protein